MAIIGIPAAGIIDSTADSQALIEGTGTRANLQALISDYDLEVGNILNHGAIPDDTGQRAANDTAIANSMTANGFVFIPKGTFYISAPIELQDYEAVYGAGSVESTLSTNDTGDLITYLDYNSVGRINLVGPGTGTSTGAAILSGVDASRTYVTDVRISGFKYGFEFNKTADFWVDKFLLSGCTYGVWFDSTGGAVTYGNQLSFSNGVIEGCQDGIHLEGSSHIVTWKDVTIQGNTRYGIYRPPAFATTVPVHHRFLDCHIEGNDDTQINFDGRVDFIDFVNCRIVGTSTEKGVIIGTTNTTNKVQLLGCTIVVADADKVVWNANAYNCRMKDCNTSNNQTFKPTGAGASTNRNVCVGRDNWFATDDPDSGDDWASSYYAEGSQWWNTVSGDKFVCVDRDGTWVKSNPFSADANFTWTGTHTFSDTTTEIKGPAGTGSATAGKLLLSTAEASIFSGDYVGQIDWQAPDESSGGNSADICASFWVESSAAAHWDGSAHQADFVWANTATGSLVERMRLTALGTLIVGSVDGGELRTYGTTGTSGAFFQLNTQRTDIQDTNILGTIKFGSQADVVTDNAAAIRARASGTWTGTSVPTEMLFYTALTTDTGLVEALRIDENQICTFVNDPIIPDEVYGVGWDGSLEPPTKNAVYDKIETLGGGGDMLLGTIQTVSAAKTFNDGTLLLDDSDTSFDLILGSTSTITTANKKLTFDVNDSDRTLTISGDATVSGSNTGDSQTLAAGVSDVTATAAELNLLDLAGLTVGWGLVADSATTASWQALPGGGNVSNTGTPTDGQIAVWTGATNIEGTDNFLFDDATYTFTVTGPVGTGSTPAAVVKFDTVETSVTTDDLIGRIDFHGSTDAGGPAAGGIAASIYAIAEEDWSGSNNRTAVAVAVPPAGANAVAQEEYRFGANPARLQVGVNAGASLKVLGTTGTSGALAQMNTQRTDIQDTNILGTIKFGSDADVVTDNAAAIRARASATWTGTTVSTEMLFYTATDTGTGLVEALRIDENQNVSIAAGDLTLTTGDIGIGTASPSYNLSISGDQTPPIAELVMYDPTPTDRPILLFQRSRGTESVPADVVDGDTTGSFQANARSDATFQAHAAINFLVDGTFTTGQRPPGRIEFLTAVAGGGSLTTELTISSAGDVTIANGDLLLTSGDIGLTGSRVTKGWFTDLEVTNAIAGSITGNAATVTTNANLTGPITSVGNATTITADSVTMDNLVDIATDTFLGRVTAATGTVEVLTNAQAKTALDLTGTNSGDSQTLAAGVSDVTATASELNLLDLAGLTVGWGLVADSATTASWQALPGGGDVTAAATIGDNLLVRGDGAVKGVQNTGITVTDTDDLQGVAILGTTGARLTKGWFTDLEVTNAIAGSVTGNAATVTTNANLTGPITSVGNETSVAAQTGTGTTFVMQASPTLTTPDIGTPTAGVLTSCTGLPISTGISGLGTGVATWLATPSSANLITAVTGETGTGGLVFADTPTLITPVLGTPTSGTLSNCTAASTTAKGVSELATASEIDTGTDTERVLSCNEFNDSIHGLKVPAMEVIDYSTAVATGDGQRYFRCDAQLDGMNLVTVGLCVGAAKSSSGAITITLTRMRAATAGAASRTEALMTSTGFDIDSAEWDSKDSSNGTIDTANDDILEGDVIRVDVDAAGTGAQGLFVTLGFRKP